jgi:uncharacterized protein (DUF362 family)
MDRREMLKLGTAAAAAGVLGSGFPVGSVAAAERSRVLVSGPGYVVKVHMKGMRSGMFPDPKASRAMVDKAVTTLARETDPGRAWLQFVSPSDRVLIKINCLGTRMLSSMREVVLAVADGIREAGVPDANIVMLDMFASNMMGGRFEQQPNPSRMRVVAHKEGSYQKQTITAGPAKARFADLLLWSTAVINVPPIKDHDLAGVTCAMKNMTFGTVEKPHLNHAVVNEAIARLFAREEIRGRVRLTIADGSRILYDGGPKFSGSSHALHECVYATTDPVAMDAVANELIETPARGEQAEDPGRGGPAAPLPRHVSRPRARRRGPQADTPRDRRAATPGHRDFRLRMRPKSRGRARHVSLLG